MNTKQLIRVGGLFAAMLFLSCPLVMQAFTIDTGAFPRYYEEGDWKTYENTHPVVTMGDFNGDGIDDIAVGNPQYGLQSTINYYDSFSSGVVYIYFGGDTVTASAPFSDQADVIINGALENQSFGSAISAGDFNGDGIDELVVGSDYYTNNHSIDVDPMASIFVGPLAAGTYSSTDADTTIENFEGVEGAQVGGNSTSNISVSDLDNDGYEDIMLFGYLFYGSSSGITTTDATLADAIGYPWYVMSVMGDFNGDGYGDILGDSGDTSMRMRFGSATRFSGDISSIDLVNGATISLDLFDANIFRYLSAGDIDNNGKDDLLITNPLYDYGSDDNFQFEEGGVFLIYGEDITTGELNLSDIYSALWYGQKNIGYDFDGFYNPWNSILADVNDDGYKDILTCQRNWASLAGPDDMPLYTGAIHVIYSSATQFSGDHSFADADFTIVQDMTSVSWEDLLNDIADNSAYNAQGLSIGLDLAAGDYNNDGQLDLVFTTLTDFVAEKYQSLTFITAPFIESVEGDIEEVPVEDEEEDLVDEYQSGVNVEYNDGTNDFIETIITVDEPIYDPISNSGFAVQTDPLGEDMALINFVTKDVDTVNIASETFDAVDTLQAEILDDTSIEVVVTAKKEDKVSVTLANIDNTNSILNTSTLNIVGNSSSISSANLENTIQLSLVDQIDPTQTAIEDDTDGVASIIVLKDSSGQTVAEYSINDDYTISTDADGDDIPDEYEDLDPTNEDVVADNISSVVGATQGRIKITYSDDTVARVTVFNNNTTTDKTKVKQINKTAYYVVIQAKGKKIAIVNAFNGDTLDRQKLAKKNHKTVATPKVISSRSRTFSLTATKNSKNKVYLALTKIKSDYTFGTMDHVLFKAKNVKVSKTKKYNKKYIQVKNSKNKVLRKYLITKKYNLVRKK